MIKHLIYIILTLFLITGSGFAQDTYYGPGYRTGILANPAVAGTSTDGNLSISFFNFYPGNSYNLNTFFMSYDTYVPLLHGGTGLYISNDVLGGIINDLRGGLGYSYHLKAEKDFYINAGITASVISRGINPAKIVLPDQIDPLRGNLFPSGETISDLNHTLFDIGVGFLLTVKNINGSIALNHFAEPNLSKTKIEGFRLKRKYSFQLSGTFTPGTEEKLIIQPLASVEFQGGRLTGAIGSSIKYNIISVNAIILSNNEKSRDLQTGISILTGKAVVYYNYKFNLASSSGQFPFSLLHQLGVTISLNNVDKRKIIKTINFPEL